ISLPGWLTDEAATAAASTIPGGFFPAPGVGSSRQRSATDSNHGFEGSRNLGAKAIIARAGRNNHPWMVIGRGNTRFATTLSTAVAVADHTCSHCRSSVDSSGKIAKRATGSFYEQNVAAGTDGTGHIQVQ